ncbi:hypothetical protein ACSYDW_08505 [Paeniglutamicibacter sp. R2-26]|uniref:hypothetical protein n=1 Tax=Paeniglutamicibacter sp. R2-26 TaxID=3144417 RepID=UPI003EE72189
MSLATYILRVRIPHYLRNPYVWACLATVAVFIPAIVLLPTYGDIFVHAATLERLQDNFWAPRDPMVDESGLGNPYFSPYMVFWATVGKFTGLGSFSILRIAGVLNLVLVLVGVGLFVRTLSKERMAPLWVLLSVFFLWGTRLFLWSGFISLPGLIATISYPSTFAVGLGMLLWAWLHALVQKDISRASRIWLATGIALGAFFVLMSHQFTALAVAGYSAFYLLRYRREIDREKFVVFLGIIVSVVLLVLAWPWFNLFQSTGGVDSFNAVHVALYEGLIQKFGLLACVIPVIWVRLSKDRLDPLSLTVLACTLVYVVGGISGNYFLGRVFPAIALLSQVAVGVAIAEWIGSRNRKLKRIYSSVLILAILAGFVFQSGFINLLAPGIYPAAMKQSHGMSQGMGSYRWVTRYVGHNDTLMTANREALLMTPAYGVFTVMPAWPDPFLGEAERERNHDTQVFFDASTQTEERREIMDKYGAEWVLADPRQVPLFSNDPNFKWVAVRPQRSNGTPQPEDRRAQLFKLQ